MQTFENVVVEAVELPVRRPVLRFRHVLAALLLVLAVLVVAGARRAPGSVTAGVRTAAPLPSSGVDDGRPLLTPTI